MSTLLRDLADSPAPPTTVDIGRAAATGRRTVRLRRVVATGSAALATVVVIAVLNVVMSGGTALPPPPAPADSATTSPSGAARPMPAAAPAAFDPMVQYAELGWLPTGTTGIGTTTSRDWLAVEAGYRGGPTGPGNEESPGYVTLLVATASHGVDAEQFFNHAVPAEGMRAGEPADLVSGRKAEWSTIFGSDTLLRWEYAPGAWAAVGVRNLPGADSREIARRVAEDVRFEVDAPIKLAFHTTAIPASLKPTVVAVTLDSNANWGVSVQYGVSDERPASGDWPLSIHAHASTAETGDGAVIGDPNTTVDGYPARTSGLLDGGTGLQLFNVNGLYLEMLTHSGTTTAAIPGGLVGLFRSMEVYPNPDQWR